MCDDSPESLTSTMKTIPADQAVGTILAHDITEIRPGEFKGPAFKKGHIIREKDVCHLRRLGKEHLFVLQMGDDEMHEDDAALAMAEALMGNGVAINGQPREGKIALTAERDGLLKVDQEALLAFNMLGEVMCATLHTNTVVRQGQTVAGTRAIPLVVKKSIVEEAVRIARNNAECGSRKAEVKYQTQKYPGIIEVKELRKPRAGVVITGSEIFYGRVKDAFAPVIMQKIREFGGELAGVSYAPDAARIIVGRLRELVDAGADLLITTGGMSVDPDDVTRFAIRALGASDSVYGSAVLPGAMVLIAYLGSIPIIGFQPLPCMQRQLSSTCSCPAFWQESG